MCRCKFQKPPAVLRSYEEYHSILRKYALRLYPTKKFKNLEQEACRQKLTGRYLNVCSILPYFSESLTFILEFRHKKNLPDLIPNLLKCYIDAYTPQCFTFELLKFSSTRFSTFSVSYYILL